MSYCWFENTLRDLQDCHEAMGRADAGEWLSERERRARRELIALCRAIADEYGGEV